MSEESGTTPAPEGTPAPNDRLITGPRAQEFAFSLHDTSRTLLTVSRDGELKFGEGAHPQEVVDVLMKVWRETLERAASGRTTEPDTARLDWLQDNAVTVEPIFTMDDDSEEAWAVRLPEDHVRHYGQTLREAIDAAMHPPTQRDDQ